MLLTIVSKNYGTQTIDTDTFSGRAQKSSSTIYQICEHLFNQWAENCHPFALEPYQSWDEQASHFSKRGAILAAMDMILEVAEERKASKITTRDIQNMDIEASFEG